MRRILVLIGVAAHLLSGASVVSVKRDGNTIRFQLSEGSAEMQWLTDSTFRFARRFDGAPLEHPAESGEPIALRFSSELKAVRIVSKFLIVTVSKEGALVRVTDADRNAILVDVTEPERRENVISWERGAPPVVKYYGLGAHAHPALDLRSTGMAPAAKPFLMSTAGYGEFHVAPGLYTFDLAKARPDRYRVEARHAALIDYYFFFGPSPKDILEQYLRVTGPGGRLAPNKFSVLVPADLPKEATPVNEERIGSWDTLASTVRQLAHASLSGILLPAFSLSPYRSAPTELQQRAAQLGSVLPLLVSREPVPPAGPIRADLRAYFATYAEEARDRGFPLIRPMPMQFSRDPQASRYIDQFMLGDEILVAPLLAPGNRRSVYLPMGIWTNLKTNQTHPGRQVIPIEAEPGELPLFSRNGALFPLGSSPTVLHYFPRLGGEFFLFESDIAEYSQVHAGPAGDLMRLEIESKKDREYEWLVHHTASPRKVTIGDVAYAEAPSASELRPGTWRHDAARNNVHVRVKVNAGEDNIINLQF